MVMDEALSGATPLSTTTTDVTTCVHACQTSSECVTAEWDGGNRECSLYDVSARDVSTTTDTDSLLFESFCQGK